MPAHTYSHSCTLNLHPLTTHTSFLLQISFLQLTSYQLLSTLRVPSLSLTLSPPLSHTATQLLGGLACSSAHGLQNSGLPRTPDPDAESIRASGENGEIESGRNPGPTAGTV